jgi:hypothetical protein
MPPKINHRAKAAKERHATAKAVAGGVGKKGFAKKTPTPAVSAPALVTTQSAIYECDGWESDDGDTEIVTPEQEKARKLLASLRKRKAKRKRGKEPFKKENPHYERDRKQARKMRDRKEKTALAAEKLPKILRFFKPTGKKPSPVSDGAVPENGVSDDDSDPEMSPLTFFLTFFFFFKFVTRKDVQLLVRIPARARTVDL